MPSGRLNPKYDSGIDESLKPLSTEGRDNWDRIFGEPERRPPGRHTWTLKEIVQRADERRAKEVEND